jgi:hypothetical protein
VKTGRRRPRGTGNLMGWARREVSERQQRTAQAIAWGPPPANAKTGANYSDPIQSRPAWIRLGGGFRVDGQVENGGILQIVSIRPNGKGGWELLGHLTAGRWYDADQVRPL